ncbi:MAG: hypothetical protein ACI4I7_02975 [Oscillospiraceae bacterium]
MKLVGLLFIFGGIWEMSDRNTDYKQLYKPTVIISALTFISGAVFSVIHFVGVSGSTVNILGLAIGSVITLITILLQKKALDLLCADTEAVNDVSLLKSLKSAWLKMVYFTLAGLFFNVFNIVPVRIIADYSGVAMAVCRIIMYVMALTMLWRFNKLRIDYYRTNR